MSQSPLARSTRRKLPAFSHAPSRLSKPIHSPGESPSPAGSGSDSPSPATPTSSTRHPAARHRNAASSTGTPSHPPLTPRIHYSPYALSTPPQSLSKSSSIPFDMAASAKAARIAEQGIRAGTPLSAQNAGKKRFVRKKALWKRAIGFPGKVYDKIVFHTPTSLQDLLPDKHLANPIALGVHVLHYLLVAPLFNVHDESTSILRSGPAKSGAASRWDKWENQDRARTAGILGGWGKTIVLLLLLALSVGNALYLFTRYRTYDMLTRTVAEPLQSPHASPAPAPKITAPQDDDIDERSQGHDPFKVAPRDLSSMAKRAATLTGRMSWFLIKSFFYALLSAFGKPQPNPPTFKDLTNTAPQIQSLRVWDPPDFCLAFFCAYPPLSPLLTSLSPSLPLSSLLIPVIHLSTAFLLSHLSLSYSQLVKDRTLLAAEVMREYDQKFVYKRIFGHMVDRATSTHESEFVGF